MYKYKCDLPIDPFIEKHILNILNIFKENNIQAWLVGGCVRDMILNKEPKDYDICFSREVHEVLELFESKYSDKYDIIPTGLKHGTITLHVKGTSYDFECTMLRGESGYSDNRHPDNVTFNPSLEEDLKRRDFTINSFAYDLLDKELIMLDESFLDDLKEGRIRTVGDSNDRLNEDILRLFRAYRFASQLNFTLDIDRDIISKNYFKIKDLSAERIRDELNKFILGDNFKQYFNEFIVLLSMKFSKFLDLFFMQNNHYHIHQFLADHTCAVIENCPKNLIVRLAALFHDIGKKDMLTEDTLTHENHFYKHAERSADICRELMLELKYPLKTINEVVFLVHKHDIEISGTRKNIKKLLKSVNDNNFDNDFIYSLLYLKNADISDHINLKNKLINIDDVSSIINTILEHDNCFSLKNLKVNGYDLLNIGFKGPKIGIILNDCLDKVIDEILMNDKDVLLQYILKEYS